MTATRLLIVTAVEPEAAALRAGITQPPSTPSNAPPPAHAKPPTATHPGAASPTHPATVSTTPTEAEPSTYAAAASGTHAEAEPGGPHAATASGTHAAAESDAPRLVHVAAVGVGPAAAAAGTARLIALAEAHGEPYTAVISAGIAGGFVGRAEVGATVLGARSIAADLGAEAPNPSGASGRDFIPIEELGFGSSVVAADAALLKMLSSALPYAVVGDVLTLATVTGTAATAAALQARFPDAVAEAMEGYGVAIAAQAAGLPFVELRTISNPVGPRDRGAWRLREAFSALTEAARKACG